MTRSNRSNSEYAFYDRSLKRTSASLGQLGLSVFRNLESGPFDPVFQALEEELGEVIIRIRGRGMEKPPGVSLLEISEVKRQRMLGQISIKSAINELYESIGSLRQEVTATPSRIQFLGRGGHKSRVLVAMFDESTANQLTDERMQILEVLEGLAEAPYEFSWLEKKRLCISLARMSASQVEKATPEARYKIEQSLPPTLALHRATLYNPSHGN